jgi:pseudaminic acid biosynthesis-associated methylase
MSYSTEQEAFWAGDFGRDYISRNNSGKLLASNLNFFSRALRQAYDIGSCVEFGANIGMNIRALKQLFPEMTFEAAEINPEAARQLSELIGHERTYCGSILDYEPRVPGDLALIKGVLIHLNPEVLPTVYERLYSATSRWLLVAEYYNPTPVAIQYRNQSDKLFKRDFAGEMLDRFPDLRLADYGFAYRKDPQFPQDDITWFLMEKRKEAI